MTAGARRGERSRSTGGGVDRPRVLARGRATLLRALADSDREEYLALVRDSRVLHRPWVSPPETPQAFARYLARGRRPDAALLAVCRRDVRAIAGVFSISEIVRGPLESGYLGYYAAARHAGSGYMTEGLTLVLRYAFLRLKLHRLEANIQPQNARSIALVERCGFRREGYSRRYLKIAGRWRDHERWAILREDWRARRRTGAQVR